MNRSESQQVSNTHRQPFSLWHSQSRKNIDFFNSLSVVVTDWPFARVLTVDWLNTLGAACTVPPLAEQFEVKGAVSL